MACMLSSRQNADQYLCSAFVKYYSQIITSLHNYTKHAAGYETYPAACFKRYLLQFYYSKLYRDCVISPV